MVEIEWGKRIRSEEDKIIFSSSENTNSDKSSPPIKINEFHSNIAGYIDQHQVIKLNYPKIKTEPAELNVNQRTPFRGDDTMSDLNDSKFSDLKEDLRHSEKRLSDDIREREERSRREVSEREERFMKQMEHFSREAKEREDRYREEAKERELRITQSVENLKTEFKETKKELVETSRYIKTLSITSIIALVTTGVAIAGVAITIFMSIK